MKGADIDMRMLQARIGANAECDPLLDLRPRDIFNACHALRREVDAIEALGVQLLAESKSKAVSA